MTTVALTLEMALPIINGCKQELEPSGAATLTVTCVPLVVAVPTAGVTVIVPPAIPNCVRTACAVAVPPCQVCPTVVAFRAFVGRGRQVFLEKDRVGGLDRPQRDDYQQRKADGEFDGRRAFTA